MAFVKLDQNGKIVFTSILPTIQEREAVAEHLRGTGHLASPTQAPNEPSEGKPPSNLSPSKPKPKPKQPERPQKPAKVAPTKARSVRAPEKATTIKIATKEPFIQAIHHQIYVTMQLQTEAARHLVKLLDRTGKALVEKGITDADSMERVFKKKNAWNNVFKGMVSEARRCQERYMSNMDDEDHVDLQQPMALPSSLKNVRVKASGLAGLTFDTGGTVALNAALEYLCAEILEITGHRTLDGNRRRITVDDIRYAMALDAELKDSFDVMGVVFEASACVELPKAKQNKRKSPPFEAYGCYKQGEYRKEGLDGNMWEVHKKVTGAGAKYTWKREKK